MKLTSDVRPRAFGRLGICLAVTLTFTALACGDDDGAADDDAGETSSSSGSPIGSSSGGRGDAGTTSSSGSTTSSSSGSTSSSSGSTSSSSGSTSSSSGGDVDAGDAGPTIVGCADLTCDANATCANDATGAGTCTCSDGFTGNGTTCADVDECGAGGVNDCDDNAACTNTSGSFTCACNDGYSGDGKDCTDINECADAADNDCDINAACSNTDGAYTCACTAPYYGTGDACSLARSCADIKRLDAALPSGKYKVDLGTVLDPAPTDVYCDMTTEGGGWTLAMKVDGTSGVLQYGSALWTNTDLLAGDSVDLAKVEAKLAPFNTTSFGRILLQLESPYPAAADPAPAPVNRSLVVSAAGASLQAVFAVPAYTAFNTDLGPAAWTGWVDNAGLEPNCNREGFNNYFAGYSGVRLGISANNEPSCDSNDTYIGIGGAGDPCGAGGVTSAGNVASCGAPGGNHVSRGFAWVFVGDAAPVVLPPLPN